ncbi:MMD (predicted) [Pycnogonum litorale]
MNCKAVGNSAYEPTDFEHLANVVTHGIWIVPSFMGLVLLVQSAGQHQYLSAVIYGLATFSLFFISTMFHSVFYIGKFKMLKAVLHRCDRAIIYIFIAASYFPWLHLKEMSHPRSLGSHLHWVVWCLAALGIAYQHIFHEKYKMVETFFYLVIGVFPSVAIFYMRDVTGFMELSLGGIMYIVGVFFFKCDGRIPCAHAIWHVFVNIGATLHFYAVYTHLITREIDEKIAS